MNASASQTPRHMHAHAVEHLISRILRWGVIASGSLLLAGFFLLVVRGGSYSFATPGAVFSLGAARSITDIAADPLAWLYAGIVLLMCTPIVRVVATVVLFASEHDWHYVRLSLIVLAIILLSILLAFAGKAQAQGGVHMQDGGGGKGKARQQEELRVMTFNIRYANDADGKDAWEFRRDKVVSLIRRQLPDVMGLQEALDMQLEDLRTVLPGYTVTGVGRDDGARAGEYAPIFWRTDRFMFEEGGTFWFSDTPNVPGSISWGNAVTRICTWVRLRDLATGALLRFYNIHLDHVSQESRIRSTRMLAQRILEDGPDIDNVIVTGDFNAGDQDPELRNLLADDARPRLVDTWAAAHPGATAPGTYHAFTGVPKGPKIDFILAGGAARTIRADILRPARKERPPSDHFPVTARIRLRPAP